MALLGNKNFANSLIADVGGISAGDTSLSVTSSEGSKFPATGSFRAVIWGSAYASPSLDTTREIIGMTLTSGDTFSISRGLESTTAKAWAQGANIALVLTAGKLDELEEYVQNHLMSFAAATGTNTYVAILDPAITNISHGIAVNLKFNNASTGVCTLQLNATTAKKLYVLDTLTGAYRQATSGDIISGMHSTIFYDSSLDSASGGYILASHDVSHPQTFASGTALLFPQASAPTGWTIDSSWATPRSIIIGNSYANGGADSATSYTTSVSVNDHSQHTHTGPNHNHTVTVNGHQLTVAEMPAHTHSMYTGASGGWGGCYNGYPQTSNGGSCGTRGNVVVSAGGNGSHSHTASSANAGSGNTGLGGPTTHTVNQSTYTPRYLQVIRCTKD